MLKIAITGANGLVGSRIVDLLKNDFEFIPISQMKMDIADKNKVKEVLDEIDFDIFLHLAAYTSVVKAETDQDLAYLINEKGTENVFEATLNKGKKFIYFSTDYVFDGEKPPFFEDSTPNPLGIYAKSKYSGEKIVENKAMIVRISYPYRAVFELKKDFYRTFRSYLEQNKTLNMIEDSLMTPTFIDDIAYGLKYLLNHYSPETYHLVGSEAISPYQACMLIAKKFNLDTSLIKKITYQEYIKDKAALPRLANIRSKKNNFYKMKSFEEGLNEIITQLQ